MVKTNKAPERFTPILVTSRKALPQNYDNHTMHKTHKSGELPCVAKDRFCFDFIIENIWF